MSEPSTTHPTKRTDAPEADGHLRLVNVTKHFGKVTAVRGIHLAVRRGELMTLLGPSGSGKTTLLRMIAGYETVTDGSIDVDGVDLSALAPWLRNIGVVAQQYSLFPHLTVAKNIAYGLAKRRWPRQQRTSRVDEMLDLVRLHGLGDRFPWQLSGGQQQRVALARALAFRPTLLLMDEPLGALDRQLRVDMTEEIRRLHRELGTTIVYVTHDRDEALALSDRVTVMRDGLIVESDTPQQLFAQPASAFVARFFGDARIIPTAVLAKQLVDHGVMLRSASGPIPLGVATQDASSEIAILPHALSQVRSGNAHLELEIDVKDYQFYGDTVRVTGLLAGYPVIARMPQDRLSGRQIGPTRFYADPADLVVVHPDPPDSPAETVSATTQSPSGAQPNNDVPTGTRRR